MKVAIYVEGAGNENRALRADCRQAFQALFEKADLRGQLPTVIPCGGRQRAYDKFCHAVKLATPNELPLLLVDSEEPVLTQPWEHLNTRQGDRWTKPVHSDDDQIHLMVQVMESWFLADVAALKLFYGQGFKDNKLPVTKNIETISKSQVEQALKSATRETKTKGEYSKGRHSFRILGLIDPRKVRQASPHAERLFQKLETTLA